MAISWKNDILPAAIFVALYVLVGNARSIQPNPLIPGATIAVNMIVPVFAGIIYGWRVGLSVGVLGTLANAISPAGSNFEYLAVVPHGIMGFAAGFFNKNFPTPILALSIIIGHLLDITFFIFGGLLELELLTNNSFWLGLTFESFAGIIAIIVLVSIYRLATNAVT